MIAVASYFRRSALKTKLLHEPIPDARAFPKRHQVQFAQHQVQLTDAVLHNMHDWGDMIEHDSTELGRHRKPTLLVFETMFLSGY